MKRILLTVILIFTAMAVFSQDMTSYTYEYMRTDGTFSERLMLLEAVRDAGLTGIGEFYHDALKYFIVRAPDIRTTTERNAAEKSAVILCEGLGAEKYTDAAGEVWQVVQLFDVAGDTTDGNTMQTALITLGQINAQDFVPHIVQRLNNFNTQHITNPETRRRVQMAVVGCINALEALHDIRGYRPVFFVSVGSYDPGIREIAANALPNIVDDPGDVLIEVIRDTSSNPRIKLTAWNEMLKSRAPEASKARVASAALAIGWSYSTNIQEYVRILRDMRKSAIDTIRRYGVSDDSVYTNLEFSYSRNFINNTPDFDEIMLTLNALTAVKTDEAVALLYKFLQELNARRRNGPWSNKERQIFEWVVSCIGATGTQSIDIRILLTTITRTASYTSREQNMAREALNALGFR
jgi:hypothetical protein